MDETSDNSYESEDSSMLEDEDMEELDENEVTNLNIMYYISKDDDEGSSCGYCHGKNCSFSYGKNINNII